MKTNLFALFAISALMVSCTSDETELFETVDEQLSDRISRAYEEVDTFPTDTVVPMVMTDEILSLNDVMNSLRQPMRVMAEYEEDPYIDHNIYAVRDIPMSMTVAAVGANSKSDRCWIRTRGAGNEVALDYYATKKNWGFRIKPMPITTGLRYLLYSDDLDVPLTVGKLKDGTAVLMAQENDDKLTDFVSWDIVPSETNPGYFQIRNTRYLCQASSSDPFSIYQYTIEASKNNNIRFAQPISGKMQQDIRIAPMDTTIKFTFDSVRYDVRNARIISTGSITESKEIENSAPERLQMAIPFDFITEETSSFKTIFGNIFPFMTFPIGKFKRPRLVGDYLLEPKGNTPKDAIYDEKDRKIDKRLTYSHPVFVNGRRICEVTLEFSFAYVSVDYEATAHYIDANSVKREITIGGTWTGKLFQDVNVILPKQVGKSERPIVGGGNGDTEL